MFYRYQPGPSIWHNYPSQLTKEYSTPTSLQHSHLNRKPRPKRSSDNVFTAFAHGSQHIKHDQHRQTRRIVSCAVDLTRHSSDNNIEAFTPSMMAFPPGCSAQSKSIGSRNPVPTSAEYSGTSLSIMRFTALIVHRGTARLKTVRGPFGCTLERHCFSHWKTRFTKLINEKTHMPHSPRHHCIPKSPQLENRLTTPLPNPIRQHKSSRPIRK
jgi:hypothetical protein